MLRIFAAFGVMMMHISAQNWGNVSVTSFQWQVFCFYGSIVRWPVQIFVMISGALFLDGDINIEKLYKKHTLRIITAFIFWSILYALVSLIQGMSIKNACLQAIQGHYHMWFLFLIVGLYLIVPLVKRITESQALIKYFLALGLIFNFIIPQGIWALNFISSRIANTASSIHGGIGFYFARGFVFYFVFGYFLSKTHISVATRYIIYILSAFGFISTILGTSFLSIYANAPRTDLSGTFVLNTMLESLGVFVLFKYGVGSINLSEKRQKVISKLSKYSFGAYLVHAMVIEQVNKFWGLNTLSFNPILSVAVIALIVFIVSFVISYIFNHIPLLNKYIV